jgi:hypothetical protein
VVFGFEVPMRRLLQGRRNFKSTTLGTVWRAGSTA